MDIVERLQGHAKGNAGGVRELLVLSADEIKRLRQQVEELVEVLQKYKCNCHPNCWDDCETYECDCGVNYCGASANRAIAKATGGE